MDIRTNLTFFAALLAAGCTATGPTTAGDRAAEETDTDCIRSALITDWEPLDDRSLIVYEGRRPYHVELAQTCFGLDFATMVAFYDRRADERICGYGFDRVIVDRTVPEACSIAGVDELTEAQAEELKSRAEAARSRR